MGNRKSTQYNEPLLLENVAEEIDIKPSRPSHYQPRNIKDDDYEPSFNEEELQLHLSMATTLKSIKSIPDRLKPKPRKPPKPSLTLLLVRICVLSLILGVGYAINSVSVLRAIAKKDQSINSWIIIYITSTIWLFISCIIMIIITFFGFKIKLFLSHHGKFGLGLFLIPIGGCIAAIVLGKITYNKENDNKYVWWQSELLYALQASYLMILICILNHRQFTQVINISLFSITLFVTPFISLLNMITTSSSYLNTKYLFVSNVAICAATSVLVWIHILALLRHYNSGLLLKTLILSCLIYYFVVQINDRINFDVYNDKYRIYYYYTLFCALCGLYVCELFVQGRKRIRRVNAKSLVRARQPSLIHDLEIEAADDEWHEQYSLQPENKNKNMVGLMYKMFGGEDELSKSIRLNTMSSDHNHHKYKRNEEIKCIIQIFPDFKPTEQNANKYFSQLIVDNEKHGEHGEIDRLKDSIAAIVPFYNEKAHEIHATLRSLYFNFEYIKRKDPEYKWTHFNVLLVGDGWFKSDISTKRYLAKLYAGSTKFDDEFMNFKQQKHKHNTVILQTKNNKKLCINPFNTDQKKLYLKVTTIIKIDNRKKANSHEWFLGRYGFAEWCKCDYMFFTDAYSTLNEEGLYEFVKHMKKPKNKDVVCCTGRARVYSIEQELELQHLLREKYKYKYSKSNKSTIVSETDSNDNKLNNNEDEENKYDHDIEEKENKSVRAWWENDIFFKDTDNDNKNRVDIMAEDEDIDNGDNIFYNIQDIESDHRLTMNAHLRACQMFEFEALYGTIGSYLLGSFLPVIPGPCGFYRSSYLLPDQVRMWYFDKINKKNDPNNMDLVLGNMKLAEDRILTISSILNNDEPVRHTLVPECIFYFDPQPSLTQLMKQRRRWINGSIATVIFVLRKISFKTWKVSCFRSNYVLSMWYMQLFMYLVVAISPPLLFTIAFTYGLEQILRVILPEVDGQPPYSKITAISTTCHVFTWLLYLLFIYYVQGGGKTRLDKYVKKKTIVSITVYISFTFGIFTLAGTFVSFYLLIKKRKDLVSEWDDSFDYVVFMIQGIFFLQSFVLAPIFSKDMKTFTILLKTWIAYFLYSPFYVSFFFINAIANVHDLSWGTRPDNDESTNNPKSTTLKLLLFVIIADAIIAIFVAPFSSYIYSHIIFFSILAFPSLYQIFFSFIWLIWNRLISDLWYSCRPRKLIDEIEYVF